METTVSALLNLEYRAGDIPKRLILNDLKTYKLVIKFNHTREIGSESRQGDRGTGGLVGLPGSNWWLKGGRAGKG